MIALGLAPECMPTTVFPTADVPAKILIGCGREETAQKTVAAGLRARRISAPAQRPAPTQAWLSRVFHGARVNRRFMNAADQLENGKPETEDRTIRAGKDGRFPVCRFLFSVFHLLIQKRTPALVDRP